MWITSPLTYCGNIFTRPASFLSSNILTKMCLHASRNKTFFRKYITLGYCFHTSFICPCNTYFSLSLVSSLSACVRGSRERARARVCQCIHVCSSARFYAALHFYSTLRQVLFSSQLSLLQSSIFVTKHTLTFRCFLAESDVFETFFVHPDGKTRWALYFLDCAVILTAAFHWAHAPVEPRRLEPGLTTRANVNWAFKEGIVRTA